MRKFTIIITVAISLLLSACMGGAFDGEKNGFLPVNADDFPGLTPRGKRRNLFTDKDIEKYLGNKAGLFLQYGLRSIYTNDYTFGGEDKDLTIESFQIDSNVGTAGTFYYYAGRKLRNQGKKLDIGAQGVLDTEHEGRNLYFYKGHWFVSLVYSGKEPIPDLVPLAKYIAGNVNGGINWKPQGFKFLEVDGVSSRYAKISWGNALNMQFLPVSVWALAPKAGSNARAFISEFMDVKSCNDTAKDFQRFLQLETKDYKSEAVKVGNSKYYIKSGIDTKEGLLMFATYKHHMVILSEVADHEAGKEIIISILNKMRQEAGFK